MTRCTNGYTRRNRHKKILKLAKGYRGRAKNCYRIAVERVEKALQYAYIDRRNRKRDFRALWIQRINAAVRSYGVAYSQFMHGVKCAEIKLNRKMLAELAIHHKEAFHDVVVEAQKHIRPDQVRQIPKFSEAA